jgi:hypothetical protein
MAQADSAKLPLPSHYFLELVSSVFHAKGNDGFFEGLS